MIQISSNMFGSNEIALSRAILPGTMELLAAKSLACNKNSFIEFDRKQIGSSWLRIAITYTGYLNDTVKAVQSWSF